MQARCPIPDWWPQLRRLAVDEYWQLEPQFRAQQQRLVERHHAISAAVQRHDAAREAGRPYDEKLDAATREVTGAGLDERIARQHVDNAGWRTRRQARAELTAATETLIEARAVLAQITAEREPFYQATAAAYKELRRLQDSHGALIIDSWTAIPERFANAKERVDALDAWNAWAAGKPITTEQTLDLIDALQPARSDANRELHQSLANTIEAWADAHGIQREQPTIEIESHSFGIDL